MKELPKGPLRDFLEAVDAFTKSVVDGCLVMQVHKAYSNHLYHQEAEFTIKVRLKKNDDVQLHTVVDKQQQ